MLSVALSSVCTICFSCTSPFSRLLQFSFHFVSLATFFLLRAVFLSSRGPCSQALVAALGEANYLDSLFWGGVSLGVTIVS